MRNKRTLFGRSVQKQRGYVPRFRLVLMGLLLCLGYISKAQTYSLNAPVTLSVTRSNAMEVLEKLDNQTAYSFTYSQTAFKSISIEKVDWKNTPLQQALEDLKKRFRLSYHVISSTISFRADTTAPRQSPGKVSGKVLDEENGQPVSGATIRIGNKGTTTDIDGNYSIALPKGNYTATVSNVGYGEKEISDIAIQDNQTFTLNITLKRTKGSLSAVTVKATARKETVASLYIRQKNAAGITDGISAEQMARTPDKNIGESLKRISGVSTTDNKYVVVRGLNERYNTAMLNGQAMPSTELNRKQFSFDIIPSNMVDNITVIKTITPDKSAEFGGGLVEVNTKDIPTENFLNLTAGVTMNDQTAGHQMLSLKRGDKEYLGEYASHRYLYGQKNWNSLKEIRDYQYPHRNENILSNNWQPYYYTAQPSQNYQLSWGRVKTLNEEKQHKLGFIASASYRNTQSIQQLATTRNGFSEGFVESGLHGQQYAFSTSLGGMVGIGYTTQKHKISWQNIVTRLLDEQLNYGIGFHENLRDSSRAMIEKVLQTTLWQSQLKGEHSIGHKGIKVNWIASYTHINRVRPDNHVIAWKGPAFAIPEKEFRVSEWSNVNTGVGPYGDPEALRLSSDAQEKNLGWDANIVLPFNISITKNIFKTGYAGWYKDRQFYVAMIGHHPGSPANYPSLGEMFESENGGGRNSISQFGDDYNNKAPLHALYGMFDNRIANKVRLVWGLRAEYFDIGRYNQAIDANIAMASSGGNTFDDVSALRNAEKKWNLFPSANLTYSITPRINFRASYSKSIIRPDLREMAFFQEYDFELGGIYQAEYVQSTRITHTDLRLEWYPGAGEVVSASLFNKDIKFPMEIYQNLNTYNLQNNYSSNTKGIELEVRKSLTFIPVAVIKNITVYGNFTALTGKVTPMTVRIGAYDTSNIHKLTYGMFLAPEEKRPLSGQSNYMFNAGLYYDDQHLHISASYNSTSNRMVLYNINVNSWQFEKPLRSLDLQIAYRFLKQRAEVKLNLSNLLQESTIIYSNSGTKEEVDEAAKRNYNQQYLLYDKTKDRILQKTTPGRTAGLSISYSFK